jgi:hypothetical protein
MDISLLGACGGGDFIKTAFIRRCLDTVHGHESCDMQQICPLVQKKHVFFFKGGMPSGYLTVRHGKSPFLIGKPSISMSHGHFSLQGNWSLSKWRYFSMGESFN